MVQLAQIHRGVDKEFVYFKSGAQLHAQKYLADMPFFLVMKFLLKLLDVYRLISDNLEYIG